eukprot:2765798-Amphidinium_carterae.1
MRVICRYCGMVAPYSMHVRLASMHESCRSAPASSLSLHSAVALTVPRAPLTSSCSAPLGSSSSRDIAPLAATPTLSMPHATGRRRFTSKHPVS